MHIPSGFLTPHVWIPLTGVSAVGIGYALKKTGREVDERKTPLMGVMAAFVFAAQLVNFPVFGGTSGHLIGSALAVAILGMWPSMLVMTSVVLIQALLFQDGGLEALGANIFNMAILGCLISGMVIGPTRSLRRSAAYIFVALAAWLSVVTAAVSCAIELSLSGTSPLRVVLPAMTLIHAVIGVFEGFVTIIALRFIESVKPASILNRKGDHR